MHGKKNYYITTPLYYVTAAPHLGSLYSTVLADVFARWQCLNGHPAVFTTGTDEHGQKIAQAAHQASKDPQAFVDEQAPLFAKAWHLYDIAYNRFIRTSSPIHRAGAQQFVQKLLASGYTYQATYEGWYCTPCETFVAPSAQTSASSEPQPCSSCGRPTSWMAEQTYFFKLSAFQDKLLSFYKNNPDFVTPKERLNEVISFVQEGLKDLSISRKTVVWGVPFPQEPEDVIYVWVEALCGYLTSVGFGQNTAEFDQTWPADVQVLGKDIIRFHAVYWPAMLMAADLPLPKKLLVHGWIKVDKQKMSKSLGNVIDPVPLCATYGADVIRYFLCRQIPVNHDGEFSIADLEKHIASDLADDLGNLVNRMIILAEKNGLTEIPSVGNFALDKSKQLRDQAHQLIEDVTAYMNSYQVHIALAHVWQFIGSVNGYFHEQEPWKLVKENREQFIEVLFVTAHSLKIIAYLLWPVMPQKMEELLHMLGIQLGVFENSKESLQKVHSNNISSLSSDWDGTFVFKKGNPLFVKPEPREKEVAVEKPKDTETADQNTITIDDLIKVMLAVGTIIACEKVPNSEKLLCMKVDVGLHGVRQILAGIAHYYQPAELVGKQATFVINLKPRKMAGLESHGMMLIAEDAHGKLHIIQPAALVPNGTRLR